MDRSPFICGIANVGPRYLWIQRRRWPFVVSRGRPAGCGRGGPKEGMVKKERRKMEKRLRCKDCRWFRWGLWYYCLRRGIGRTAQVKPGQFACKKFEARKKGERR